MFIGRKEELKIIEEFLDSPGQKNILLYGRRRIGKSELLFQVLEGKSSAVYYECKDTDEMNNLNDLAVALGNTLNFPKPAFESIEELLKFCFQYSQTNPLILVLDEYPFLREHVNGLDSIIQVLIDQNRKKSNLKLILSGSYVDVMQKIFESDSPLYGRFSRIMKLEAMDYYDSAKFYPEFSNEDKVRLYSVFGGVPYYNELIDSNLSVEDNIIHLIASKNAVLASERMVLLSGEIRKIANANLVFEAVANGYTRFNDILNKTRLKSDSSLTLVMKKLMSMQFIKKEGPINQADSRKYNLYLIDDPFMHFYYTYISRNSSDLPRRDPHNFYDSIIREDFEHQYVPHYFETIVKQFLIRKNRLNQIDQPFTDIGKYVYNDKINKKNGEFDVVTKDDYGYIFYEVKFQNSPLSAKEIEKEVQQVNDTGLYCHHYGFVSKSGFSCEPKANQVFYTLDDMFSEDLEENIE